MKITPLRNATIVIHSGDHVILVDPMLAPKAAIPSLKYMTSNRRRIQTEKPDWIVLPAGGARFDVPDDGETVQLSF